MEADWAREGKGDRLGKIGLNLNPPLPGLVALHGQI